MKHFITILYSLLCMTFIYSRTPDAVFMDGKLEIFLPDTANQSGIFVLCCPGGGYTHLAIDHEGRDFAPWLNKHGIGLGVLAYTMPNGDYTRPLADVHEAFAIIDAHKTEWSIKHTGIMGFSAGGHLASTAATKFTSQQNRPEFQILFYPVITMDAQYTHKGSCSNLLGEQPSDSLRTLYSSDKQVRPDTPRAFILLCDDDKVVSPVNSTLYYNALKTYDIPAELYIYPEGGHGFGFSDDFVYKVAWKLFLIDWLKRK